MTRKLLAFPATPKPKRARQTVEERSHIVLSIGGERFALDLCGSLTELNPVDAPILSIGEQESKPKRKRTLRSS